MGHDLSYKHLHSKETINKIRQPTKMGENITNDTTVKGLKFNMCKQRI